MENAVMDADAFERRLGRVLAIGSLVSTSLFAAGLMLLFVSDRRWADALVHAGLIVLLGTPFARVIVTIVSYWRARDWMFVAMTTTVLLVLIGSVLVATF